MISQIDIERIISACRIEEVIGDFVDLKRKGANYAGICPFHDDHSPSMMVSTSKNIFKCFVCGTGGDAVSFVMKHENYTYPEALKYLAQKYGIEIKETEDTAKEKALQTEREQLFNIVNFAKTFFSDQLHHTEEGQNVGLTYFESREFLPATINDFQLGYSPKTKDALVQHALKNGYSIELLQKAGLAIIHDSVKKIYSDRFHERVIFPIHNTSGRVIGFGGRVMSAGKPIQGAKYINSPESEIYHKSNSLYGLYFSKNDIHKKDKCFLVEGYTDVISFHQVGIKNVVSSSGTSLTQEQIKLIKKYTNNITIIYDGDNAGIHAAIRGVPMILKEEMNVRVVLLPPEDDPDSFAKNHSLDECLNYINENEQDFINFYIDLNSKDIGNDPIKKAELLTNIASMIAITNNVLLCAVYVQQCSAKLHMSEDTIAQAVKTERAKMLLLNKKNKNNTPTATEEIQTLINNTDKHSHPNTHIEVSANSMLEKTEKNLLKLLFNKGESLIFFENEEKPDSPIEYRIDQYIIDNLAEEEIDLSNDIYQKLLNTYISSAEKYNTSVVQHILMDADEETRNQILNLQELFAPESIHWTDSKINSPILTTENNEAKLCEEVVRTIQYFKLEHLEIIRNRQLECLKQPLDEQLLIDTMQKIQNLNQTISEIESILGVTIRK